MRELQFEFIFSKKKFKEIVLLLNVLFFFLFTNNTYSQDYSKEFIIQEFNPEETSFNKTIYCLFQDKRDFVWLGTPEGLFRYDGYSLDKFEYLYDDPNSVQSNHISKIIEDKDKQLWIATIGGGLSNYNWEQNQFVNYLNNEENETFLYNNDINTLATDKNENIFLGYRKGSVDLFIKKTGKIDSTFRNALIKEKEIFDISELAVSENNFLWVGTWENGVYKIDLNNPDYPVTHVETKASPENNYSPVTSIYIDSNGNTWEGNRNGELIKINANTGEVITFICGGNDNNKEVHINDINELNNRLYVATSIGLFYFDEVNDLNPRLIENEKLQDVLMISLLNDSFGNLWIGTNNGLLKLKRKKFTVTEFFDQQTLLNITALEKGINGKLYIGTWGDGLFYQNQPHGYLNNNVTEEIKGFKEKQIYDLLESEEEIKVGLNNNGVQTTGVDETKQENSSSLLLNSKVTSLCKLDEENYLAGTYNGLFLLNQDGNIKQKFTSSNNTNSLSDNQITCITKVSDNEILIGTALGGLNLMFVDTDYLNFDFYSFRHNRRDVNSISSNFITAIYKDMDNTVWIGTENGGLNKLIKIDSDSIHFKSYTEKDGFIENKITGILDDEKGNLWISGKTTLSVLNKKTEDIINYTEQDGIGLKHFCSQNATLKFENGQMYFAGNGGIVIFHPDSISKIAPPKIYIKKMTVVNNSEEQADKKSFESYTNQMPVWEATQIKFPPSVKSFSFELIAIDLYNPKKVSYYYMLEGFDKGWIELQSGRSVASYTNIKAGEYKFKFKAANSDGVFSTKQKSLDIIIKPPLWQRWWAMVIYFFILIGLYLTLRKMLIFKLTLENKVKLEQLSRKKDNELNQLKLKFFTDMSHELRTPLSLILGPAEKLKEKFAQNKLLSNEIFILERNAKRLLILIDQFLDVRKIDAGHSRFNPKHSDVVDFLSEVSKSFKMLAESNNIEFALISSFESIKLNFDKDKLEKVIYNLLSNAFKYTPKKGKIYLELFLHHPNEIPLELVENEIGQNDLYLNISVYNSGKAIASEELEKLFERYFRRENDIQSKPGTGIGLSIVSELVEVQKGKIFVQSIDNLGICFTVSLPIMDSLNNEQMETMLELDLHKKEIKKIYFNETQFDKEAFYEDKGAPEKKNKSTLLIIEDDIDLLNFIASVFQNDYNLILASDGNEGAEDALNKIPDLIISDIMLPGKTGTDICKILKQDIRTSHIPVILLTALTDLEEKIKGIEYGADDYIAKPFSTKYLKTRVDKLIESRKQFFENFSSELILPTKSISKNKLDEEFIHKLTELIKKNLKNSDLKIEDLSNELKMSRIHLFRKIKSLTNLSPSEFIRTIRLKQAAKRMLQEDVNISEIAYSSGFNSPNYFAVCFKKQFGQSPRDFVTSRKTASGYSSDN